MKYEQFAPITEEQLDEVAMSPAALDKFIQSDDASGIRAGFEAELCFPGKSGTGIDYDADPELDDEPDRRIRNGIDDVCDFFDDGDMNGRRDIERLRSRMTEDYTDWLLEKTADDWDNKQQDLIHSEAVSRTPRSEWIKNYLLNELSLAADHVERTMDKKNDDFPNEDYMEGIDAWKAAIDEMVEEAINEENELYDEVYEEWREESENEYSSNDWLNDQGIRYMGEIPSNYDIAWPYWRYPESEGGWNDDGARDIASDLRSTLEVNVTVSGGYHDTARKPDLWIIEPDGSIDANDTDDMPAEIVSPPYPLGECLDKMRKFFDWASDEMSAYSNESTGLHVGVSLPDVGGEVDLIKLALFLGDRHVLDQFGRAGNTYAESALRKIEHTIGQMPIERVEGIMDIMRRGFIELAGITIKEGGYGKYTSINMKGDYIEFRSMGNNYMDHIDDVINNVKRYAYAMWIASRPDMYREEYARKLYNLIKDSAKGVGYDVIKAFAHYTSKDWTKEELKELLRQRQAQRQHRSDSSGKWRWMVYKNGKGSNGATLEVVAGSREEALEIAAHSWRYPDVSYLDDADVEVIGKYVGV